MNKGFTKQKYIEILGKDIFYIHKYLIVFLEPLNVDCKEGISQMGAVCELRAKIIPLISLSPLAHSSGFQAGTVGFLLP